MSNFATRIPVDVAAVKALLPNGAYIESVEFDGKAVVLKWSHHRLLTPFTTHFPYSVGELHARQLPDGVMVREDPVNGNNCSGSEALEREYDKVHDKVGDKVGEGVAVLTPKPEKPATKGRKRENKSA